MKKERPRNKTQIVSFSLDHDLVENLKAYAAEKRQSRTQVIRELMLHAFKGRKIGMKNEGKNGINVVNNHGSVTRSTKKTTSR